MLYRIRTPRILQRESAHAPFVKPRTLERLFKLMWSS